MINTWAKILNIKLWMGSHCPLKKISGCSSWASLIHFNAACSSLDQHWQTLMVSSGCSPTPLFFNILSSLLFGYLLQLSSSSLVSSGSYHLPNLNPLARPKLHDYTHHRVKRIFADIVLHAHQYLLFLFLTLCSSCLFGFVRSLGLGLIFVLCLTEEGLGVMTCCLLVWSFPQ